ncbi:MAG: redoxin domain-containing protein [Bacteroidetes bacterium]|nr:redoxin domain-containing protein [Bacteroidota bacterium]
MKPMSPILIGCALLSVSVIIKAQNKMLPNAELYTLDGQCVNAQSISNDSLPMILVFWKTTDLKCCENLFMMNEAWKEELQSFGVKLVAICVDCIGKTDHVKPYVNGHAIEAEVYIDKNGDFRRKMAIPDGPYTILFDHDMNIHCQSRGYCPGADEELCEKVMYCLNEM